MSSPADKLRGAYIPLTEEEIEAWRSLVWKCEDAMSTKARVQLPVLCDMAINSLLYAEEIQRLRSNPSADQRTLADAKQELAELFFQCARYERPSTDWKKALDDYTAFAQSATRFALPLGIRYEGDDRWIEDAAGNPLTLEDVLAEVNRADRTVSNG